MIERRHLLLILAVLVLMMGAAESYAQFGGRASRGGGGVFGSGARGSSPQNENNRVARPTPPDAESYDVIEYRLSLLEEGLRLQATQLKSWDTFAQKVRAYASDLARERARALAAPSGSAANVGGIRHIEQAADSARNHATALDDIAAAAKALYSGLTSEQTALADIRIPTIVAPAPPRAAPGNHNEFNLPYIGSGSRPAR